MEAPSNGVLPMGLAPKVAEQALKALCEKLTLPDLLKLRDKIKQVQMDQLAIVQEALVAKGHVEPHHVGILEHTRE